MRIDDGGGGSPWLSDVVSFSADTPSGSQTFRVSRDGVQTLIKGLEDARDKLEDLYQDARGLRMTGPPGDDPYSNQAMERINDTAGEKSGGYLWANRHAHQALQNTIDNLKASAQSYGNTEDSNTHDIRSVNP
jgi:hypothetical protein